MFVPEHYHRDLHFKLIILKQGSKSLDEHRQELELCLFRLCMEEDRDPLLDP